MHNIKIRNIFYKTKICGNKTILSFLGLPFYIKKYDGHYAYYSLLGIRILKKTKSRQYKNPNTLKISVDLRGGLGDQIINANFVYLLRQIIENKNVCIDIYEPTNIASSVFKTGEFVDHIYHGKSANPHEYDLCIELSRFPVLKNVNKKRILHMSPKLFDFVLIWIKDNTEKYKFIDENPRLDGMLNKYYLSRGYKRWQQFDIEHKLDMTENFPAPMFIGVSEQKYIKQLKLPKKFITIHRGVDIRSSMLSVKQWPLEYYNELIEMIRKKYPNVFIVQLGDSQARCPEFNGIDLNLSGKTSLEQLKVLLKNSILHIDGEGGMVHLRHALKGGTSIVFFGPTDPEVYGYSENINLAGNGCRGGCEWVNEQWQTCCVMGTPKPFCQYSLKPDMVYKNVDEYLSKNIKGA